jgi:hypothetical protein
MDPMSPHPEQVVITFARCSILALHTTEVHHRDLPEAHGEGRSPGDAADRLADLLARTLDCAPSDWHRETIERAIEDVQAFASHVRTWPGPNKQVMDRQGADSLARGTLRCSPNRDGHVASRFGAPKSPRKLRVFPTQNGTS